MCPRLAQAVTDRSRLVGEGASAVQAAPADAHQGHKGGQDGEAGGGHGAHHSQDQLPIEALFSCPDLLDWALTLQPWTQ